jgi:hypothetical protein
VQARDRFGGLRARSIGKRDQAAKNRG